MYSNVLQKAVANIHEALDEDEQFRPNAGYVRCACCFVLFQSRSHAVANYL